MATLNPAEGERRASGMASGMVPVKREKLGTKECHDEEQVSPTVLELPACRTHLRPTKSRQMGPSMDCGYF